MDKSSTDKMSIDDFSPEQRIAILGVMAQHNRLKAQRKLCLVGLGLVYCSVIVMTLIDPAPLQTWQVVIVVLAAGMMGISEWMGYYLKAISKSKLISLGVPEKFVHILYKFYLTKKQSKS